MARSSRLGLMLATLLGLSLSCRCGGGVDNAGQGFTATPESLEFGRVLRGTPNVTRTFELLSTGRSGVTVALAVEGPFEAPARVELPGSGSVQVTVIFTAPEGRHEGTLTASAAGSARVVTLRGEGVVPLDCQPSKSCRVARFDLESGTCQESLAQNGAGCVPQSLCLENGVCLAGECVGTPRSCDDQNTCTQDACSPTLGCVHTERTCPVPANPCRVATCDPEDGCGEADAENLSRCGSVDCVTANLCFSGDCKAIPTPEGLVCAPATPCQPVGTCQGGSCVRPDPTPLEPEFSLRLPGTPTLVTDGRGGRLHEGPGGVYLELCGLDGGVDAGCALASYTVNGFERFVSSRPDGARRALAGVSGQVVALLSEDALEALSPATGAPLWSAPLASFPRPPEAPGARVLLTPSRVALGAEGETLATAGFSLPLALPDGGVAEEPVPDVMWLFQHARDGGVLREGLLRGVGSGGELALSADGGALFVATPEGTFGRVELGQGEDGGRTQSVLAVGADAGSGLLSLAQGTWVVDSQALYQLPGGALAPVSRGQLPLTADERPDSRGVLLNTRTGYGFLWRCVSGAPPPCTPEDEALFVRGFALAQADGGWPGAGVESFRHLVLPPGPGSELASAALVLGDGVCSLTQRTDGGAGVQAQLQVFTPGGRALACDLPADTRVHGATFFQGRLLVVAERDAGFLLESYELRGVPLETVGWPQPQGLGGNRRERSED